MRITFSTICYSLLMTVLLAVSAFSQIDASTPNGRPPKPEELPKNIQEQLAKQRIEREKKDYRELLQRSEEAVKLSGELENSFVDADRLSAEDEKKLDRLEKLVKKIRSELGAGDDDETEADLKLIEEKPSNLRNAIKILQSNSVRLFNEIKKSTRYSISVISIQTSNALLKVVRFIRFGK